MKLTCMRCVHGAVQSDPAGISDDAVSQEWTKQRWTWVPDEKDGFVAARVQSESGGNATVELVSGQVCLRACGRGVVQALAVPYPLVARGCPR